MLIVLLSALGMLAIAWGILAGPELLAKVKPRWLLWLADQSWLSTIIRYVIVIAIIGAQLFTYHLWLTAGKRRRCGRVRRAWFCRWCFGSWRPSCSAIGSRSTTTRAFTQD